MALQCSFLITVVFTVFGPIHSLDWYSLTERNYAAIQSGLAELNSAAGFLNQSIIQSQSASVAAVGGLNLYINKTLTDLYSQYPQYPSLILSSDQFSGYMWNVLSDYRRTVTANVMMPAQMVVRTILDAINDLYYASNQRCAEKYAANIVQPRISVGRLKECLVADPSFLRGLSKTAETMMDYQKDAVNEVIAQLKYCAPDATGCRTKFFKDFPSQLNTVVASVGSLFGAPEVFIQPAVARNKQCVALTTSDIQDAINAIKNNITVCA